MKYIKKFNTIAEANAQGAEGLDSPHVDLIVETNTVNYAKVAVNKFNASFDESGKIEEVEPIVHALKFEIDGEPLAQDANVFYLQKSGTPNGTNFEWSYDGVNWTPFVWSGNYTDHAIFGSSTHPFIYVRGNNPNGIGKSDNDYVHFYGINDIRLKVSGNIKYLLGENIDEIPCDYCFAWLFRYCAVIIDTSRLILPFDTLTQSCYRHMFSECSHLQYPPQLPATNLAYECYASMFYGTHLKVFPEIPATVLAERCYNSMFNTINRGDTNIDLVLPARASAPQCYRQMFTYNGYQTLIDGDKITILLEDLDSNKCIEGIFRSITAKVTLIVADGMKQAWLDSGEVPESFTIREVSEPEPHNLGDIAYWDGEKIAFTPYTEWDDSLGTAIGVCFIPTSHAQVWGNGKARFLAVTGVNEDGSHATSEQQISWDSQTRDAGLTKYTKIPTWNNAIPVVTGSSDSGYISSDKFTGGTQNVIDIKSYYNNTSNMIPSPYATDDSFYEDYRRTIDEGNVLSDFNGKVNTATIVSVLGADGGEAAKACSLYSTNGTNQGDWYLPAMGELGYIMSRFAVLQAALAKCGEVSLDESRDYWSSTEYDSSQTYIVFMDTGIAFYNDKSGVLTTSCVRPVIALD